MDDAIAKAVEVASKVTNPVALVAIAIIAAIVFVTAKRAAPKVAWAFLIFAVVVVFAFGTIRLVIPPPKYQIRVRIEDPEGHLMKLQSGVDLTGAPHEMSPREGNAEWLFQVFPQDLPPDKKVTISVNVPDQSLSGSEEITLTNRSVSATLRLEKPRLAEIAGTVINRVTGAALSGATIYVVGQSGEVQVTDRTGGFRLSAHAPAEQLVTLHTECKGFRPDHQTYTAGRTDVTVSLESLRKIR